MVLCFAGFMVLSLALSETISEVPLTGGRSIRNRSFLTGNKRKKCANC